MTRPSDLETVLHDLDTHGFHVIEGARPRAEVQAVRAELAPLLDAADFGVNSFIGTRTKRVHSVFGRTRALDDLATDSLVLEVVAARLGDALLSASVACEIHPGETVQAAHTDDGIYPLPADFADVALSALWALDDFTAQNGGTLVYPGSQGRRGTPPQPHEAQPVEMPAGSVLLYTGTLWHGGGANTSDAVRPALILTYVESWLRAQDAHLIAVPVETAKDLTPELRALLGYAMRPPFLGYVDGCDPRELFEGHDSAGEPDGRLGS